MPYLTHFHLPNLIWAARGTNQIKVNKRDGQTTWLPCNPCVGKLKALRWDKYGDLAIFVVTGFGGSFLVGMGHTNEIFVAYVGYILFRMSYQTMMTVASFEIAKDLKDRDCSG